MLGVNIEDNHNFFKEMNLLMSPCNTSDFPGHFSGFPFLPPPPNVQIWGY